MTAPLRVEATVESLAPGGDGVAHVDVKGERRAVFVPRTAPGDRALLEVSLAERPARGAVVELRATGPGRVPSPCAWSDRCGGCDWMHLSSVAQHEAHVALLRAALPAAWRDEPIAGTAVAEPLGTRSRARLHVRCGRSGRPVVGMFAARTHDPVAVERCVILAPALEAGRAALASVFEGSRGRGEVHLAHGAGGRAVLDVDWDGELADGVFGRIDAHVRSGPIEGAQITLAGARKPARIGDPTPWTTGADGEPLRLAPGGFAQASDTASRALATHVAELARGFGAARAVELYAGSGNLTVLLARAVGELTAVEVDGPACEAARANLKARSLAVRIVEGDAETYRLQASTPLVVLDPPRSGARGVAERLAASRVEHVIYVSCDTQTLGRDLGILGAAYAPLAFTVFEAFAQTSHVETVVALRRVGAR